MKKLFILLTFFALLFFVNSYGQLFEIRTTNDTIKVRLLIDEGGTIPVQRNGWQVFDPGPIISFDGRFPPDILFLADKKTRVDNAKVWQFKRFNW